VDDFSAFELRTAKQARLAVVDDDFRGEVSGDEFGGVGFLLSILPKKDMTDCLAAVVVVVEDVCWCFASVAPHTEV
jgi:hypothetical protein